MDLTPQVNQADLKLYYNPSLQRILGHLSNPASMERVLEDKSHQDSRLIQHPVSKQGIVKINNELNKRTEDKGWNIKLYSGTNASVA